MATATVTRRVTMTMPRHVSEMLDRKAQAECVPLSKAILGLIEDAIEYAEEGHIWEEALERKRTCTGKFLSHDEFWKQANALSGHLCQAGERG